MRVSRIVMGTGVSLDVPDLTDKKLVEATFARLVEIDNRFSTYKDESEISRYRRGEISEPEISAELRGVIDRCVELETQTDGYFSAWFSGRFDPTGYVKGWAIAQASEILRNGQIGTFCLSIGGDVNLRSSSDKVWQIGIRNPDDSKSVVGVIKAKNLAVATSGNYLRGQHIINPKSGRRPKSLKSLSVCGPDIILADVLATAGFAAGKHWPKLLAKFKGYEAMAITDKSEQIATEGMRQLLV